MSRYYGSTLIALVGAASLTFGAGPAPAQEDEVVYTRTSCWKANPGKSADLRGFFENDARTLAEEAISQGRIVAYSVLQAVIPSGSDARCDFLTSHRYIGFPSELGIVTDEGLAKLKMKAGSRDLTRRIQPLGHRTNSELWRMVDYTGSGEEGSFLSVDLMKTSNRADWEEIESTIFKPMHAARIADGERQAWSAHSLVMPRGTGLEYDAATVNVVANLKSMGTAPRYADRFKKVHPGKNFQQTIERTQKTRDIVESNLYRVIVLMAPESE